MSVSFDYGLVFFLQSFKTASAAVLHSLVSPVIYSDYSQSKFILLSYKDRLK